MIFGFQCCTTNEEFSKDKSILSSKPNAVLHMKVKQSNLSKAASQFPDSSYHGAESDWRAVPSYRAEPLHSQSLSVPIEAFITADNPLVGASHYPAPGGSLTSRPAAAPPTSRRSPHVPAPHATARPAARTGNAGPSGATCAGETWGRSAAAAAAAAAASVVVVASHWNTPGGSFAASALL